MNRAGDASVRDPRQIYVTLRKDLHVSVQSFQGKPCYILEDPQEIKFYRLGIEEGSFVSMLDGKTPLDDILRHSAVSLGKNAFSEQEAMQIVHWLLEAKLAHPSGTISLEQKKDDASSSRRHNFNPLAIRIPLTHPDRFFTEALPRCAWLFGLAACGLWTCACLAAVWRLIAYWSPFINEVQNIVAPRNWPSLMIAWVFLKFLHECAHGLVCKKYGGIISEAGIMILWGMPAPYVDVTSSWAFRSKRQRIYTALAGIYIELFIAALAMLFWSQASSGWLHYWCGHIVVIAGISSLLFNGNPLMRFDAYYVLMDLLEIPNLYSFGQQFWSSVRGKLLVGTPVVLPGLTQGQRQLIACYGLLAGIWRLVVYLSLMLLGLAFFPFDESLSMWCALAIFVGVALWRFGKDYRSPSPTEKPSLVRYFTVSSVGFLILGVILFCFSTPFRITAPAIVEYKPLIVIRNYTSGFVRTIEVSSGQSVEEGQIIAVLANDELDYELQSLDREIAISRLNLAAYQHKEDIATLQAEQQNLAALEKQHNEKQEQYARLEVRAPVKGIIVSRHPESLLGKYLSEGSEVVSLGDENSKELRVSVEQDDADAVFTQVGKVVWIRVGGMVFQSVLSRIEPHATLEPLHPAMAATKGGPLPVKYKAKDPVEKKEESGREPYELLTPQFTGEVTLLLEQSNLLASGQRGQISFSPEDQSMGEFLFSRFQRWCRDKIRRVRTAWNL
jgi:putative peptide zinc metalloprotease protein